MKLTIDKEKKEAAYLQLYTQLKEDILRGHLRQGARLPSKRLLAAEQDISVITVEHAMELLADEGYIEARPRSGYYVIYKERAGLSEDPGPAAAIEAPLDLSEPDPWQEEQEKLPPFPFSVYAKIMRKVIADYGESLMVKCPNNGSLELRSAISGYLKNSRGIYVDPDQIVIGAGAEYLYGILVQILGRDLIYGIEDPSYEKIRQVYQASGVQLEPLALGQEGILSVALWSAKARVLHISPYRSFPSGVTASASKRREYLRWAGAEKGRFLIEDDVESEFSPSTKAEETLFSLADSENVIYLNTFSKTIAPSVRAGYMVLPKALVPLYKERAGFYSCTVPAFEQYALAEFIRGGDFERHINRVRRSLRKLRRG